MCNTSKRPVRVLHILTGLAAGGAESFIMNMYRHMDRSKVQFDFLLRSEENIYKDELEKMGSRVYITAPFPKHFIENIIQTSFFFKKNSYDAIHVHANALLYTYALSCARKHNVKCRIIHSHNTAMAHMHLLPIHNLNKKRIQRLATDFFACSEDAGKWMFPGDFSVINNAIDLNMFAFNKEKRREIRAHYGIQDDELVIGHVGRFVEQKNHAFLVDLFAEIVKRHRNVKLMLVGDGVLRQQIEEQVRRLGLGNKVLFLGTRRDTSDILNAFDVFVFPSLFEGLGIVAVEAQANGLRMVCSDSIPDQVLFDKSMRKLSLSDGPSKWADVVLGMEIERLDLAEKLKKAGYDVKCEAQKLQSFYLTKA